MNDAFQIQCGLMEFLDGRKNTVLRENGILDQHAETMGMTYVR